MQIGVERSFWLFFNSSFLAGTDCRTEKCYCLLLGKAKTLFRIMYHDVQSYLSFLEKMQVSLHV